jgi:phage-related protein
MATGTRALTLKLLADVDNFTKNLDKADKEVLSFGDKVSNFGKKAGLAFAAAGAAAVAYAGKLAIDGVKSAIADAAAQEKLALTLKNVTGATDAQIKATEDYITKTSLAFGVTDDELRPSLERLSRATGDLTKAQKLQAVAIDVSAGSGKSLEAVTNAMAKAAEGNTAALGKLGIGLSSAQLKTMSMDQITAKLADTFENQASTKADTFQGKLTRLQIAFDEGKETVGSYILTAITPMVETIVNKVIPAIQEFTSNLGEKLQPVMKIIRPVIDGLTAGFNLVKNSLASNNDELKPFFSILKSISEFVVKYMAPAIGETLGFAFKALGKIISTIIDQFANFVETITKIYETIKGIIAEIKGAGSAVGNFFSNASMSSPAASGPSFQASPFIPTPMAPSGGIYQNVGMGTTNITVNGAIDPISTARQIANVLNSEATSAGSFSGLGVSRAYLA